MKFLKNEKYLKYLVSVSALVLAILAFQFGGIVSQFFAQRRYPAAVDMTPNAHLQSALLPQEELIKNAEVVSTREGVGLELGAFLTKNDQGVFVTTCEVFSKVELTFHADGMAVSGDAPRMIVEGPCEPGEDQQTLAVLPINKRAIQNIPTKELELIYEERGVSIRFENVSDDWPGTWILQNVKLTGMNDKILSVAPDEIRKIRGGDPITLNW